MRISAKHILLLVILLWEAGVIHGQTCTANAPCVQVQITNPNTVPSPTVLWSCVGTCTQAALNAVIATQTPSQLCPTNTQSVWHCAQFSQTKTPQMYNDPESWGSQLSYASQGTTAGGVSAASPIVTFQMPPAPAQQTSITGLPTVVTTGSAGPQ